jgi:hypothetical protein
MPTHVLVAYEGFDLIKIKLMQKAPYIDRPFGMILIPSVRGNIEIVA